MRGAGSAGRGRAGREPAMRHAAAQGARVQAGWPYSMAGRDAELFLLAVAASL